MVGHAADASFRFHSLVRKFHSVTSLVLSCVQSGIGLGHQGVQIRSSGPAKPCDSEAGRDSESVARNSELLSSKLFADALDGNGDVIFFFYVGDDYEKFFASQAAAHV